MSTAVAVTTLPANAAKDATGYVRATLTAGGVLQAGGANEIDFGQTVGKLIIQNNTAATLWFDYENPATKGSFKIGADRTAFPDITLRKAYLYVDSGGAAVNGTTDNGIVAWGAPVD